MRSWQRWRIGAVGLAVLVGATACTDTGSEPASAGPSTVRVMQFNIEYGGTLVDFDSVPSAVRAADADVVALQEAYGNTCKVAKEVGWAYCDRRTQTISRYPLIAPTDPEAPHVLVAVAPGKVFGVINVHLPSAPYGPNRAAAGATETELIAGEKGRLKAIEPALESANGLQGDGVPVVVIGDFNTPSHLDWTGETEGLRDHVFPVQWPVTQSIQDAGLVDAYREVYPDPVGDQGLTWPASRPKVGSYNPGPAGKPADRIDMTFVSADIAVDSSEVVGEEGSSSTDVAVSPWPGDHRAVVTQLNIPLAESAPYVAPAQRLSERGDIVEVNASGTPTPTFLGFGASGGADGTGGVTGVVELDADGSAVIDTSSIATGPVTLTASDADGTEVASGMFWVSEPGADPQLSVGRGKYGVGDPIDVKWSGAPGNKWDWLGVYRRGADPNVAYYKLWAYTGASIEGSMMIDDAFGGGGWPLPAGEYDVLLLEDDSYQELARAPFTVKR
ncbi:MAG TPA: endonuclease/exonuclease/phosphatase family protein [Actinomycetes bacterium]|nr:endonuclease/exonuclease/phosphatase family protein [Actinomycetes bacterium]